ncbi:MAG TPA: GWxTD domain-containing protein [Bacteroidales bacterium]|nr:GWxTD domain-containing protein [Bacteroidales bacterium]
MAKHRKNSFIISIALLLVQCAPLNKMSYSNLAYLYDPDQNDFRIECLPWHSTRDRTDLYFSFSLSDLLYEKKSETDDYLANFNIHYELFDLYNDRMLIDSGTVTYPDFPQDVSGKPFISSFPLKTRYPGEFVLNLTLTDLNRKQAYTAYCEIKKTSVCSRQNFMLSDEAGSILFESSIGSGQEVVLKYNEPELPGLWVNYYHSDFPVAGPPFLEQKPVPLAFEPDSLFRVRLFNGETDLLTFAREGIYFFQADTAVSEGFTLLRLHEGYPGITHPVQMTYPVRYLTTQREYEKIETNPDKRKAVEEFWLQNAGNPGRAAQMIKRYYTRVEQANQLFTSFQEGWKTDRGMIYIIYGNPTIVYRQQDAEQWIYGNEGNILSLTFNFTRVINPFTDNDFELERSGSYKESWYMAVESWRR